MAITKIQSNAFPPTIDLSNVDLTLGAGEVLTANIADANVTTAKIADGHVTHAKLHTDMDLSGKTVTLPTLDSLDVAGQFLVSNVRAQHQTRITAPLITGLASDGYISIFGDADATNGLYVKDDGKVGIGVTSPVRELQIGDNTSDHEVVSIQSSSTGKGSIMFGDNTTTSAEYAGMLRYDHANNSMQFWGSSTERMRIDSSGNVGIGTDSPTEKLQVHNSGESFIKVSTATTGSAAFVGVRLEDGDGDLGSIGDFASGRRALMIDTGSGVDFQVYTNNQNNSTDTPRMAIDTNGAVGLSVNPEYPARLSIQGQTWGNGVHIKQAPVWIFVRNFVNTGVNNNPQNIFVYGYDHANWNNQWIKVEVFNRYYWSAGESAWILDSQSGTARELYNQNTAGSWSSTTTQINSNLTRRTWTWNGSQYRTYGFRVTHGMTPVNTDPNSNEIQIF